MMPDHENARPQDAAGAWIAHYAAVSKRRTGQPRPRRRRVLILGHRVQLRTLFAGVVIAVAAGGALLAAILAVS
jgi:hypothetical protein